MTSGSSGILPFCTAMNARNGLLFGRRHSIGASASNPTLAHKFYLAYLPLARVSLKYMLLAQCFDATSDLPMDRNSWANRSLSQAGPDSLARTSQTSC